jgi:hypothetical protein
MEGKDPMNDKKFKKLMDKWASHELEAAPELRPTEEMYQKIKTKKKKSIFIAFPRPVQWAAATATAVAVILLTVFYSGLFTPGQKELVVGLRKEFATGRGAPHKGPGIEPGKGQKRGGKKGPTAFSQLLFQYQKQGKEFRESVDIRSQKDEKIILTSDDNYRLLVQLFKDRFVSIYQLDSDKKLIRLFPNKAYSSIQNPLKGTQLYYLPSSPDWFHLDKNTGEEIIYVIASARLKDDWDDLFAHYARIRNKKKKQEVLKRLLDELASTEKKQLDDVVIHKFTLHNK